MTSADSLIDILSTLDAKTFSTELERVNVKNALLSALRRVQTPFETAQEHVWTYGMATAAIKTLLDAGLWKKWVEDGGEARHVRSLAAITGVDADFLRRLLRPLAGQFLLTEVDVDTYALTPFSAALGSELFPSLYAFLYGFQQPVFANYPKFAAETNYRSDTDPAYNNFNCWYGRDKDIFDLYRDKAEIGKAFNDAMILCAGAKTDWTSIYPSENIVAAAKEYDPLVVDVGGGAGHDLEKFRVKHPEVPSGSLIFQDLPHVIEAAQPKAPIVKQAYDFFTPQPIKGARAYYLHCVIHDWPDAKAVEILENLAGAMERGYSRILLYEAVLTPRDSHPAASLGDFIMLTIAGAVERTEDMWHELVSRAGLKITKIWSTLEAQESIIEIELI